MCLSDKRLIIKKVEVLGLETTAGSAFMLAIVINEEVVETKTSFLAFRVMDN